MSAIAGFWSFGGAHDANSLCRAGLAALSDYGPHGSDSASIGDLTLGRNFFRLLPNEEPDRQPLLAGRNALVADLRLDNRDEIAAALGLGAAEADSALLLAALQRWGEGAVERIVGDFAFAWSDDGALRLVLARDPLGQRPLFWHRGDGFVAFASMPRAIHATDLVPRRPDAGTVARHLAALPQAGPASFFEDVLRVEPGHVVTLERGGASRSGRYWTPRRHALRLGRFDDYVEGFRAELDRAVACRLRGTGGAVTAHLSGGWDSSAVAATAARLLAADSRRLIAFTSVPRGGGHGAPRNRFADEGPLAAATAALHPNIDHVLVEGSGRSPVPELGRWARLFERPVFNPDNHVWLSEIRSRAREAGASVLLTGETGNWTISAAPNSLLADYLRERRWGDWSREALAMLRQRRARLRGVAAASFGPWLPGCLWRGLAPLASAPGAAFRAALHPRLAEALAAEIAAREAAAGRPRDYFARVADALSSMDFGEYRKGILGGWGIDKRDATADVRLIDFCLSLPLDMLMSGGTRRPLARAALADRLPREVLEERGKGYQGADWGEALTADLPAVRTLVERIAAVPAASSLIDVDLLRRLVRDWPEGGWDDPRTIAGYRIALLTALAAGAFLLSAGEPRDLFRIVAAC